MLVYPHIDPVVLQIGVLKVHWYGVMYLVGFLMGWYLAKQRVAMLDSTWGKEQVADLIFYIALGVVLGGRLGYVLFYQPSLIIHDPLGIFAIWQGGMSFHGGMLGVLVMMLWFGHKNGKSLFAMTDFIAPLVPIGLGAGRIGNFINGELWGRPTDLPWGMIFPHVDQLPRHPSQLYEFLLEGVVLFVFLWIMSTKKRPEKTISAWFLIGYGGFRFLIEFFREPDRHLGFIAFDWMTMGQLLSLPMVLFGIGLLIYSYKKEIIHD